MCVDTRKPHPKHDVSAFSERVHLLVELALSAREDQFVVFALCRQAGLLFPSQVSTFQSREVCEWASQSTPQREQRLAKRAARGALQHVLHGIGETSTPWPCSTHTLPKSHVVRQAHGPPGRRSETVSNVLVPGRKQPLSGATPHTAQRRLCQARSAQTRRGPSKHSSASETLSVAGH